MSSKTASAGPGSKNTTGSLGNIKTQILQARSLIQQARQTSVGIYKTATALAGRKIQEENRKKTAKLSKAEELELRYAKRLPGEQTGELLKNLLQQLKGLKKFTFADVLTAVRQFFPDPSDQYEALGYAAEAFAEEGLNDKAVFLKAAQQDLMNRQGPEIRAGINILPEAQKFAQLDSVQNLRDFYRDTILHHLTILTVFRALTQEYGAEHLNEGLDYLIRAATADLNAQGPSIDKSHLKAIIDHFYEVGALNRMQEAFANILNRMETQYSDKVLNKPTLLMEEVLKIIDAFKIDEKRVAQLPEKMNIRALAQSIDFMTGLYEQLRLLPLKIYTVPEGRSQLLEATQKCLDRYIEAEEKSSNPGSTL